MAPENIIEIHNVHLQFLYSAAKPPTIGPRIGPIKGAKQKRHMAKDLSYGSLAHISEIVPPATAMAGETTKPVKKRSTRIDSMFCESPTPILNKMEGGSESK